jgi:alpha-glucosidase (family GH31 glycosyl hydrolase)
MRPFHRTPFVLAVVGALALSGPLVTAGSASATGPGVAHQAAVAQSAAPKAAATTDTSPVNLSTNVNMANGLAAQAATVVEGDARFEVLSPEVVRMEYSATGSFLNLPTFDILDRNFTVPSYTTSVQNGWLVITTSAMVLKYQLSSGQFTSSNTQLQLLSTPIDGTANVSPSWTTAPAGPLGGYIRSYDSSGGTYTAGVNCGSGQSDETCTAPLPTQAPGVLDQAGWYLLNDTQTDVWTSSGWIAPRPTGGDTQDGYLFGYGENYNSALTDLAKLTGPTPMLPESLFGDWFSQYYGYSASNYENTILPQFTANGVTLDNLSVDTDWKSPNTWDGLEWNASLFPDPSAFLSWAETQDVNVALNIHASVATNDPSYAQAQAVAGNTLATGNCDAGTTCAVWDWSNVAQAESYFDVEDPTQNAASFTWLDWCCDGSNVSMAGVTPDSWINHLTAQQMINDNERGFVLSRIGASYQNSQVTAYPSGPWADHRSAVAFTGDTWGTWNTLASEAQLAQNEGSIGEPYVSDDIGSFLGQPSGGANDSDDLYLRWLQLGTFQPIMREHSNAGQNPRLPWEYDATTQAVGDQFMQLRTQLVPYLYTLSNQATTTGLPMAQALYLDYPTQASAYTNPTEYMLGPSMLVAPVTTPGATATTQVWFPPGTWVDWFTGATFTGPSTQTLNVPTSRMPVFVQAGGIVPLQPSTSHASAAGTAPLTLRVFAGGNGTYSLYNDAGTGLGYQSGQSTETPISYTENATAHTSTVTIGATTGSYPSEPASRTYTVSLVDLSQPTSVQVNGTTLPTSGWTYNAATDTLQVPVPATATGQSATITQTGGSAVQLSEPSSTTPPAGTNLALNQPTSASGYVQGYAPANAVDGNTSSYWESTNNAFPQWFQVDLGSASSIDKITLDLPPSTSWATRTQTLSIQGSTDGSTFTNIVNSASYTFNPATGNTVTITFPSTSTRYLRINFTANSGWPAGQISELQAFSS